MRGRYESEGEWYAFAREAPDGYDTVEWLAAQPWSNGRIGTKGGSYAGSDQSALATMNPPHLETMVVAVGASNYFHSSMRQNGALEQRFHVYIYRMAAGSKEAAADPALKAALTKAYEQDIHEIVGQFPMKEGATILSRLPSYERWAIDIMTHGEYGDYWKQRGYAISEYYDEHSDVPTLYLGGLVRLLRAQHLRELHGAQQDEEHAPDAPHGALDPWPVRGDLRRRRRLRRALGHQPERSAARLVRSLPQGHGLRGRLLAAGALLHDGHRRPED